MSQKIIDKLESYTRGYLDVNRIQYKIFNEYNKYDSTSTIKFVSIFSKDGVPILSIYVYSELLENSSKRYIFQIKNPKSKLSEILSLYSTDEDVGKESFTGVKLQIKQYINMYIKDMLGKEPTTTNAAADALMQVTRELEAHHSELRRRGL